MLQRLRGNSGIKAKAVYTRTLDHADLWDTALESSANVILCTAGVWTVIGRYQVPAQQLIRIGFGSAQFPDNQGYVYFALYDDTATNSVLEEGKLRIVQRDYDNVVSYPVKEWHTREIRGDVNDKRKKVALPEQVHMPFVGRDSYIEIQFKAAATDSLIDVAVGTAAGLDVWQLPVTIYVI